MQRYLGIDTHSKSSTIYVMSAAGKKVRQDVVETNGQALIGYLAQIPGQLHVCLHGVPGRGAAATLRNRFPLNRPRPRSEWAEPVAPLAHSAKWFVKLTTR